MANTQLNLHGTKITLLIVIDSDPRIRELTRSLLGGFAARRGRRSKRFAPLRGRLEI